MVTKYIMKGEWKFEWGNSWKEKRKGEFEKRKQRSCLFLFFIFFLEERWKKKKEEERRTN